MPAPTAPRPYTKTAQAQTTLHPDDLARLDALALQRRASRADTMRQMILDGLDAADRPS